MSTLNRLRRGGLFAIAMGGVSAICANADPALRYVQNAQGLVAVRVDAGASAPAPAHRPVDSTMVQGVMTQVLRDTNAHLQSAQGLVAVRVDAGGSAPVPAHRPVDSTTVQGAMTQVLRDIEGAASGALASPAPAVAVSETVLPNGAHLRTFPSSPAAIQAAPVPTLTIADSAGEVMPRPLVLYRKPAPGGVNR